MFLLVKFTLLSFYFSSIKNTFKKFNCNPVLMADVDDCLEVMKNTPDNVGLLIDVAHLKVSSNVLKFDKINFLNKCDSWIKGYHLSDNDGTRDSNEIINNKLTFLLSPAAKINFKVIFSITYHKVNTKIGVH